jgi:hypothetical protein
MYIRRGDMKRIITVICCMAVFVFSAGIGEARVSEKQKSEDPEGAFLRMMRNHYRDCEKKDHLEDFVYLGLEAGLESYDIASVPKIDSIAILPPYESFTFKGGLIEGLSENLIEKSSYKITDSLKVLEVLKERNMLTEYSAFRNELYEFDYINKGLLDKFGKIFNVNYFLVPRIYEYSLVRTGAETIAVSKWAIELNLISVKNTAIEWTLVTVLKSVDLQMTKEEQLGNYATFVLLQSLFGFSSSCPLGASRRRLKERTEKLSPDYKEFTTFLTDIIVTLDRYGLEGKAGIPKNEREYKTWLRSGTFPRLQKAIY